MTTPSDPKPMTAEDLASQLFDATILQYPSNPREAVRRVILFLTEALIYAISVATSGSEADRRGLFKSVADTIAAAAPPVAK